MARWRWRSSTAWSKEQSSSRSKARLTVPLWSKARTTRPERGSSQLPPSFCAHRRPERNPRHGSLSTAKLVPFFAATDTRSRSPLQGQFRAYDSRSTGGFCRPRMGKFAQMMSNSRFRPTRGRKAATGVFSRGYIENKGDRSAPKVKQRIFDGPETLAKLLILTGLLKRAAICSFICGELAIDMGFYCAAPETSRIHPATTPGPDRSIEPSAVHQ